MLFVTLPTRGDHPEILVRLIDECGLPADQIIVVRTDPSVEIESHVTTVDDFGPINIHRWWNLGIDTAQAGGATAVLVANDDIVVDAEGVAELHEAMEHTGATLATPGDRFALHTSSMPRPRTLTGSLWLVNVEHGLRPDERYQWFFGDDDLDIRARTRHHGIVTVPIEFQHLHASESSDASPVLKGLIEQDEAVFRRQHPAHYVQRRLHARTLGRTGRLFRGLVHR